MARSNIKRQSDQHDGNGKLKGNLSAKHTYSLTSHTCQDNVAKHKNGMERNSLKNENVIRVVLLLLFTNQDIKKEYFSCSKRKGSITHRSKLASVLNRDLVNKGCNHPARSAPWRPEIDQHWHRALEHQFFKGGVRHRWGCKTQQQEEQLKNGSLKCLYIVPYVPPNPCTY